MTQYDNERVKISGACTMSHQPFPYDDIWEPVLRVIDAFGLKRCIWGTDWTRTIGMLTSEQGVTPFRDTKRLSENDKAALMGRTLQKVYRWQRNGTDPACHNLQEQLRNPARALLIVDLDNRIGNAGRVHTFGEQLRRIVPSWCAGECPSANRIGPRRGGQRRGSRCGASTG